MESKPKSRVVGGRVVEEFEPMMDWVRDTAADTLQIHLPGFKKDQLKVQVTSMRVLKISGERQLSDNKWSTFRKEIPISSNYDTNEIAARFDRGILYVKHPKVIVQEQLSSVVEGKVEPPPPESATEPKKQPQEKTTSEQQPEDHVAKVGMEKQEGGKIERAENDNLSPKTPSKEREPVINEWKDKSTRNGQVEAEAEGIATRSKSAKPENPVDSTLDSTNTIKDEAEKGKLGMEIYKQGFSGVVMDMKKSRTLLNLVLSKPKSSVAAGRVVEEFEPMMDWVRDTAADTLQIHLPGFKKDQLKVQVTSMRVLKISGERQLSDNRWSTFRKEIPISSYYNTNEIGARFDDGILYVKHPKVIVLETPVEEKLANDQKPAQEKAKPPSIQVSSKSEQLSSAVEGKVEPPSESATETKKQPRDKLTSEQQPGDPDAKVGMEKQEGGKIERAENDNLSPKTPTKEKEPVINEWKEKSTRNGQVEAEAEGIATRSKTAKPENPVDSTLDSTNTIKDEAEKGKLGMEIYKQGFSGVVMDMKKSRTLVNLVLVKMDWVSDAGFDTLLVRLPEFEGGVLYIKHPNKNISPAMPVQENFASSTAETHKPTNKRPEDERGDEIRLLKKYLQNHRQKDKQVEMLMDEQMLLQLRLT
ncbi:hypothetical protein SADUNF_Sadunf04G0137100 [Salix dunnii]|uniref:SHSP domain-containing protein n=1 Tax=Salix dunnii TaxID=1413687 RepID=A0A835K5K3_9ROSI|nr:hypothetical protein SADUNF_Sadunf04G0137100 [Salix dunnii]